jgi:acyl-CoA synthetase (AMP-forming)/AMP-acid ligase II
MMQVTVDQPGLADHDLSSVESLVYAASPITASLLERTIKAFPDAEFRQFYGQTELAPIATALTADAHCDGSRVRSAGRAAIHADIRIVDENDNEVPRGRRRDRLSRWTRHAWLLESPGRAGRGAARRLDAHR